MNVSKKRIFGVSEFKTFVSKGVKSEKKCASRIGRNSNGGARFFMTRRSWQRYWAGKSPMLRHSLPVKLKQGHTLRFFLGKFWSTPTIRHLPIFLKQSALSSCHAKLAEKLRTLLVLTPLVYWCINLDLLHVGEFLCLTAYSLLALGFLIGRLLETDTLWLTPTLPTDARQILVLFSGTSILPSRWWYVP